MLELLPRQCLKLNLVRVSVTKSCSYQIVGKAGRWQGVLIRVLVMQAEVFQLFLRNQGLLLSEEWLGHHETTARLAVLDGVHCTVAKVLDVLVINLREI